MHPSPCAGLALIMQSRWNCRALTVLSCIPKDGLTVSASRTQQVSMTHCRIRSLLTEGLRIQMPSLSADAELKSTVLLPFLIFRNCKTTIVAGGHHFHPRHPSVRKFSFSGLSRHSIGESFRAVSRIAELSQPMPPNHHRSHLGDLRVDYSKGQVHNRICEGRLLLPARGAYCSSRVAKTGLGSAPIDREVLGSSVVRFGRHSVTRSRDATQESHHINTSQIRRSRERAD